MQLTKAVITAFLLTLTTEAKHVRKEHRKALELGPGDANHKSKLSRKRSPDSKGALVYNPDLCASQEADFVDCLNTLGQSLADGPCVTCWMNAGMGGVTSFASCNEFEEY